MEAGNPNILSKFFEELKSVAVERLAQLALNPTDAPSESYEASIGDEFEFERCTSVIVESPELMLQFKVFFSPNEVSGYLKKSITNVNDELVTEFVKEYCNVIAGILNASLGKVDPKTIRTIPNLTERRDFKEKSVHKGFERSSSMWHIKLESAHLLCKVVIHFKTLKELELLDLIESPDQVIVTL